MYFLKVYIFHGQLGLDVCPMYQVLPHISDQCTFRLQQTISCHFHTLSPSLLASAHTSPPSRLDNRLTIYCFSNWNWMRIYISSSECFCGSISNEEPYKFPILLLLLLHLPLQPPHSYRPTPDHPHPYASDVQWPQSVSPHHIRHTPNNQKTVQIHTAPSVLEQHFTHPSNHHKLCSLRLVCKFSAFIAHVSVPWVNML